MNADQRNSSLRDKRVLVTGAGGFIGTRLCQALQKHRVELHGVSRKAQKDNKNNIRWWQGDLSEIVFVRNVVRRIQPDIIFHLASHVAGSRDLEMIIPTFKGNFQTAFNLLIAAEEIGCEKLVLVGSQEEPDVEDMESVPCSPYAAAKWSASSYARMFHSLYNTPVCIARLFMVYGPGQQDLSKLVPYVILSLLQQKAPMLSGGSRLIDWIFVDDVVEGLMGMAISQNINGNTLDIGSGTLISIKDTVLRIVEILGSSIDPVFGGISDRTMEVIRKAKYQDTYSAIGWKPTTSFDEGLQKTTQWYATILKEGKI